MHRRSITYEASIPDSDHLAVVGRLVDERPAAGVGDPILHDLELRVLVERATMQVKESKATMHAFPHAECPDIESAFSSLEGATIGGGFGRIVRERVGGVAGCAHLFQVASGLASAVVQAALSARHAEAVAAGTPLKPGGGGLISNKTCHIWAEDGPGPVKVELGWPAGVRPVPRAEELARLAKGQ